MSSSNGNTANHGDPSAPPTDLELMLYVDGELDEARRLQVEHYLLHDPSCRAKVEGLTAVADVIRDSALASSAAADGIADVVMAKIGEERSSAAEVTGNADVPPLAAPPPGARAPFQKAPANDNARGIVALAALAAAAAAAMMIWGRTEPEAPRAVTASPPPAEVAAPQAPPGDEPTVAAPPAEGEIGPGVEIAAVDFGARMGTVFYVPREATASGPTTTVVWLSDDGPGGQ